MYVPDPSSNQWRGNVIRLHLITRHVYMYAYTFLYTVAINKKFSQRYCSMYMYVLSMFHNVSYGNILILT